MLNAQKRTVSGYVVDAKTGETIIGVNVIIGGTLRGAATDGNGYFVIPGLEAQTHTLRLTHIAYDKKEKQIDLTGGSRVLKELVLQPAVVETEGVSIVAEKAELADLSLESGHRTISAKAIRRIPASYNDVFRAIKFLPGVEAVDPFSPLYAVRGGDTGENLILLDGVPIYNPYHFVSSSGLFNVYALKNVELMLGGFGVEYGGRNSSVLYITTREGNNQALHGEVSPSTSRTQAVVDFPVGKNATAMLSGRFYYDLVSRFLMDAPSYFYDFNGTLTWKLGERNRLSLRYFASRDDMDFQSDTYFGYLSSTIDTDIFDDYDFGIKTVWKNQAVSAILKSVLSPNVYLQTQVYGSFFSSNNFSSYDWQYETEDGTKLKLFMETDIQSQIRDTGLKSTINIQSLDWNTIKAGIEVKKYTFKNDMLINRYSEGAVSRKPGLLAGFIEDKLTFGLLSVRPGVRISRFYPQRKWQAEYRLNGAVMLTDKMKLKAAWGQYLQPIISLNTQEYELSQYLDNYYPLMKAAPSRSVHSILGFEWQVDRNLMCTIDLYHKDITRTYTYDYNVSQMEAVKLTDKIRTGRGSAYGLELMIKGQVGQSSGWISYGYSRSTRSFPHIMGGKVHLFDFDRPHTFKAVINHSVNPALEFSGALRILSGVPKTLESGMTFYNYYSPVNNAVSIYPLYITPEKNNIRLPFTLRLDLGLKKRVRKGFGANLAKYIGADEAFLDVTFGNLLCLVRRNVWFYLNSEGELYGIGSNYFPEIGVGYSVQF